MSPLSIVLNLLWIVFGGLAMALAWVIAGLILAVTIIGLPFAWAHLKLALAALCPIGLTVVATDVPLPSPGRF